MRLNLRLHSKKINYFLTAIRLIIGGFAQEFGEFPYQTRSSWSRERRVIGKAEILPKGENPRFIVTNLPINGFSQEQVERFTATACYEEFYCARGDMENRIKEQ